MQPFAIVIERRDDGRAVLRLDAETEMRAGDLVQVFGAMMEAVEKLDPEFSVAGLLEGVEVTLLRMVEP